MVRNLPPVPSTLRNRNRINNKSRLKIILGNFEADSLIPDEDEEKHRLQQSVLGVDQEDANVSSRFSQSQRATSLEHCGTATRGSAY